MDFERVGTASQLPVLFLRVMLAPFAFVLFVLDLIFDDLSAKAWREGMQSRMHASMYEIYDITSSSSCFFFRAIVDSNAQDTPFGRFGWGGRKSLFCIMLWSSGIGG